VVVLDIVFYLIFIHLLGDIVLQHDRYASKKNTVLRYMVIHCWLYAGAVSIGLYFIGKYSLWTGIILFVSHFLIDQFVRDEEMNDPFKLGFYGWVDQFLHLAVLGGLYLWVI
jgi:hypothetical protein